MKTLNTLLSSLDKKRRQRVEALSKEKIAAIHLQQARESTGMTQETVAKRMGVTQASLSRMERRSDVRIGNIARYVEALGGTLEVRAVFGRAGGKKRVMELC